MLKVNFSIKEIDKCCNFVLVPPTIKLRITFTHWKKSLNFDDNLHRSTLKVFAYTYYFRWNLSFPLKVNFQKLSMIAIYLKKDLSFTKLGNKVIIFLTLSGNGLAIKNTITKFFYSSLWTNLAHYCPTKINTSYSSVSLVILSCTSQAMQTFKHFNLYCKFES